MNRVYAVICPACNTSLGTATVEDSEALAIDHAPACSAGVAEHDQALAWARDHQAMRTAIVAILADHGYSSSPWTCRCGTLLDDADLPGHQADVIAEYLVPR